jgi:hypothetical protein
MHHISEVAAHFLNNLSGAVQSLDTKLKQQLRADLDGLPKIPEYSERPQDPSSEQQPDTTPFYPQFPICHETDS